MAVSFIVEDGTGKIDSTSYIDQAYCDDYAAILDTSLWDALSTNDKQNLLMWSTRLIDINVDFYGNKTITTSALRWPRAGVSDRDDILILSTEIPSQLKDATAELAIFLSEKTTNLIPFPPELGLTSFKVGSIQVKYAQTQSVLLQERPKNINKILTNLGFWASGLTGGFKPIKKT